MEFSDFQKNFKLMSARSGEQAVLDFEGHNWKKSEVVWLMTTYKEELLVKNGKSELLANIICRIFKNSTTRIIRGLGLVENDSTLRHARCGVLGAVERFDFEKSFVFERLIGGIRANIEQSLLDNEKRRQVRGETLQEQIDKKKAKLDFSQLSDVQLEMFKFLRPIEQYAIILTSGLYGREKVSLNEASKKVVSNIGLYVRSGRYKLELILTPDRELNERDLEFKNQLLSEEYDLLKGEKLDKYRFKSALDERPIAFYGKPIGELVKKDLGLSDEILECFERYYGIGRPQLLQREIIGEMNLSGIRISRNIKIAQDVMKAYAKRERESEIEWGK